MRNKMLVFILVLSLLFAACGGDDEEPTDLPAPTDAPVVEEPTEAPSPIEPPEEPSAEPVTIEVALVDYIPDVTDTWLEEQR
jgi:outer membrane biosynthesis protein TonB